MLTPAEEHQIDIIAENMKKLGRNERAILVATASALLARYQMEQGDKEAKKIS